MNEMKARKLGTNLQGCINDHFKADFFYDARERTIYQKSTNQHLVVDEESEYKLMEFLKDVCAIVTIGNLVEKDKLPEFFTFHISSYGEFQPTLNESGMEVALDLMTLAIDKVGLLPPPCLIGIVQGVPEKHL